MYHSNRSQFQVNDNFQTITVLVTVSLVFFILTLPSQAQYGRQQNNQQYNQQYNQQQQQSNQYSGNSRYENRRPSYPEQENDFRYQSQRNRPQGSYGNNHRMPPNQNDQQGSKYTNIQRNPDHVIDENNHKCQIYVPTEFIDKYNFISKVQGHESNKEATIIVCCEGYERVRFHNNWICRPKCDNCQNGYCTGPNECQCYEGFVKNDNDDCVFTCPLGCLNGQCYLDGTCVCDPGYKLDETRKFCRPICTSGCGQNERLNCTEPEICNCAKGYQLMDGCQPTCEPDCGIGGRCEEPNICACHSGYRLIDQVCQADCYQKCVNGVCISRNRCICNPGYKYHEQSTYCVPV